MPKSIPQSFDLYPLDVASTTPLGVLAPVDMDHLTHSTRLPGGFHEFTFDIGLTEAEFWDWRVNGLLKRLRVEEPGGHVIWEGRLERVQLVDVWRAKLVFRGYFRNFTDATPDAGFSPNTSPEAAIQTLRDSHMVATTQRQLSTDNSRFVVSGTTVNQDYNTEGEGWNCWRIITDAGKGILTVGNSSDQSLDIAVWGDRVIYLTARTAGTVDWNVYLRGEGQGLRRLPVDVDWERLANNIKVNYRLTSTLTRTAYAEDTASSGKYLLRDRHVPDIGESAAGTADQRRDSDLAQSKELTQQGAGIVVTKVFDIRGNEWPLCRVRAGEVIRVVDFVPRTADLDVVTQDAFSTFVIEQTTCNHERGELTIRPDRDSHSLATIIARAGIGNP